MSKAQSNPERLLHRLTDKLNRRRESILNRWYTRCQEDQTVTGKFHLDRAELTAQALALLNRLTQCLKGKNKQPNCIDQFGEHWLHRWQRDYSLLEQLTVSEHLYWVIVDEIQAFQQEHHQLSGDSLSAIYRQVLKLVLESNRSSVLDNDQLRQSNATGQASGQPAINQRLQPLSKHHGEYLRQTAHDLRASFGILRSATSLLQMAQLKKEREQYVDILNRNMAYIHDMMLQLTDYARIEAGQEKLDLNEFDAAALIRECVALAQPLIGQRNLSLQGDGPQKLMVRSDAVKVQRILHNLLSNAVKYTQSGWVSVSWAAENETCWVLIVQDSGVGFSSSSPVGLFVKPVKSLGQPACSHQSGGTDGPPLRLLLTPSPFKLSLADHQKESEGLGLFIVKNLCDLLGASLAIESSPGKGTRVRVRFLAIAAPVVTSSLLKAGGLC